MRESKTPTQWSKKILEQYNWSRKHLFDFLQSVPDKKFQENNIASKKVFIQNLQLLIYRIERNGDMLHETKDMVAPGSILESLDADYKIIRSEYLKQIKQLKNQLATIKQLL